jgi:hypothetical protein
MQDEWNNNYLLGDKYKSLDEALPDVNDWLKTYGIKVDKIEEYSSTFGYCFDTELEGKDEEFIMIRGFIIEE